MADPIHYRPHHFLCPLGFEGKGYSPGYTANMSEIVIGRLRGAGGDKVLIEVKAGLDDICAPCSKKRGSACAVQEKIAGLDRAHAAALRIAPATG